MSKILNTLSAIGALVMAATPLVAVGGMAHAAEIGATPVHINVSDLDLSRPADAATFRQRVDAAAESFCTQGDDMRLSQRDGCRNAIRQEATAKLGSSQRQALAIAAVPTAWRVAAN